MQISERQKAASVFYSRWQRVSIYKRKVLFTTNGGSTRIMTRREVELELADVQDRLATKVRAPKSIETLTHWGEVMRQGLALAKARGL